jgi:flavin-dependent dehydrogenase
MWTRYGWTGDVWPVDAQGTPCHGYNMRRETLDPILRTLAAATPGVTACFGSSLRGLILEHGSVRGIRLGGTREGELRARLVVAADGRNSGIAGLAGIEAKSAENVRFGAFRAYRHVPLRRGSCSQMWFHGSDVGYIFPNDGGVTVAAYMATKNQLEAYRGDPARALERSIARLPDAPDLSGARALGDAVLVKDYPNLWRPAVAQGMAFVGDALMSLDPLWGIGCGFAFQSAEWLADSTAEALRDRRSPGPSLTHYARTVSRRLGGHRFLTLDFSRRNGFNPVERLMFAAAAKDPDMSRHVHAFGARLIGPARFLSPVALARAAWINLTRPPAAQGVPA